MNRHRYGIEIDLESDVTNEDYGIYNGVMRCITGSAPQQYYLDFNGSVYIDTNQIDYVVSDNTMVFSDVSWSSGIEYLYKSEQFQVYTDADGVLKIVFIDFLSGTITHTYNINDGEIYTLRWWYVSGNFRTDLNGSEQSTLSPATPFTPSTNDAYIGNTSTSAAFRFYSYAMREADADFIEPVNIFVYSKISS